MASLAGYHDCPCRDCFETAIGTDEGGILSLCCACESAGCDAFGGHECESEPTVYLPNEAPSARVRNLPYCGNALASYAWPGGYPLSYLMADGGVLCPACANGEHGSEATQDPRQDDKQWSIVACDVYWEGPPMQCDHCSAEIESAYGDPWEGHTYM